MSRRLVSLLLALPVVIACAGPAKLAQKSEDKLASGEHWRAWELATRALDKAPGNTRAREAAEAAATSIARDWERRIHALAEVDSLSAAEQVLEFAAFRAAAVRYATVPVSEAGAQSEQSLRRSAARTHYQRGTAALTQRPKKAWGHFTEAQRYVPEYRDAARLAERAQAKATTRLAVVPFRSAGHGALGQEVASSWRDDLVRRMAPPATQFTRMLGGEAIEGEMTLSQLSGMSREEAVRIGRKAGVERIVWGSINDVDSETRLHLFTDVIARRIVEKDAQGATRVGWVDIPIQVVARVRTVTAEVEYEVVATRTAATLARHKSERQTSARVVWTSFTPQGELDAYSLVSDLVRANDPDRTHDVESRWRTTCGDKTTLRQVLEARRSTRSGRYSRDVLPRFIAGAAFVFLEDLPPVPDLAYAALAGGWAPLHEDLVRLDQTDDMDLGVAIAGEGH